MGIGTINRHRGARKSNPTTIADIDVVNTPQKTNKVFEEREKFQFEIPEVKSTSEETIEIEKKKSGRPKKTKDIPLGE